MKIALQIILMIFMVLYFFAALNQSKPEKQRFYLTAGTVLAAFEVVISWALS